MDQGIRFILLGLKQGCGKAHISHLEFDDDALLSSAHDYIMLNNLKNVVRRFEMSGLGNL